MNYLSYQNYDSLSCSVPVGSFRTCRILLGGSDRYRTRPAVTNLRPTGGRRFVAEFSRMGGVLRRRESIFLLCVDLLFVEASVDLLFVEASTRCVEASTRCETCCLLLYRVLLRQVKDGWGNYNLHIVEATITCFKQVNLFSLASATRSHTFSNEESYI